MTEQAPLQPAEALGVLRRLVGEAHATYGRWALGLSIPGGLAMVLSALTFWKATNFSGMIGGVGLLFPFGLWMAVRWHATRPGGPLLSLLESPHRIVWHYLRVESVQSRSGTELRRKHAMIVADEDGDKRSFWVDADNVGRAREALEALAPHAAVGFSEERARLYRREPLRLRTREPARERDAEDARAAGSPYRGGPDAGARDEDAARAVRRRARRVRRVRNAALAIGVPTLLVAAWLLAAAREQSTYARVKAERAAWWRERSAAAIEREARASAAASTKDSFDVVCKNRLERQDWAALVYEDPGRGAEARVVLEACGSPSSSSFHAPGVWDLWCRSSFSDALSQPPWRYTTLRGAPREPLFYARLLPDKQMLVRVVDRETGELFCQGVLEPYLTNLSVEIAAHHAVRTAMWSEE